MVGVKNGTREAGLHSSFEEGGRVGLNRAHLWNGQGSERAQKSLPTRRFRRKKRTKIPSKEKSANFPEGKKLGLWAELEPH